MDSFLLKRYVCWEEGRKRNKRVIRANSSREACVKFCEQSVVNLGGTVNVEDSSKNTIKYSFSYNLKVDLVLDKKEVKKVEKRIVLQVVSSGCYEIDGVYERVGHKRAGYDCFVKEDKHGIYAIYADKSNWVISEGLTPTNKSVYWQTPIQSITVLDPAGGSLTVPPRGNWSPNRGTGAPTTNLNPVVRVIEVADLTEEEAGDAPAGTICLPKPLAS